MYVRICARARVRAYAAPSPRGKGKGDDGKSKKEEALKIKREGEFDTEVGASRVSRNEGNFALRKEG